MLRGSEKARRPRPAAQISAKAAQICAMRASADGSTAGAREARMTPLATFAFVFASAVAFAVLALLVFQRRLQYFPDRRRTPIERSGLTGGEELLLTTSDGEILVAWHFPPAQDGPVILYFHGASGALIDRAPRLRLLLQRGYGLLAVSFRGYGGSTGSPSEAGLMRDAETAYHAACRRYPCDRIIIVGASLGTGMAVNVAAKYEAAGLVLLAPFSSAADIAQRLCPVLPVGRLMRDPFRSDLLISKVRTPLLVIHGAQDRVIPLKSARSLFQRAHEPKTFLVVADAGHVVLGARVLPQLCDWIDSAVAARLGAPAPPSCAE
jgi:uncharacterized protein